MALLTVKGIGASPGIGLGRAYLLSRPDPAAADGDGQDSPTVLDGPARVGELERLRGALEEATGELARAGADAAERLGPAEAAVFEAQALFLHDPALIEPVEAAIHDEGRTAPDAVRQVFEAAARDLEDLDDPYLSGRAADVRNVQGRVARLLGKGEEVDDLGALATGTVLVARDLMPGDVLRLRPERMRGVVLAESAPTAHAAILTRGLGLPLVVGLGATIWRITPGQTVILDGESGAVLVEPDADEREEYDRRRRAQQSERDALRVGIGQPARTSDGQRIALLANVGSAAEADVAVANGAEGIGLLRTEFLLSALAEGRDDAPDEDELTDAYAAIFARMGERPIIVRAMDAGGDKPLPFLPIDPEPNPFLGWRGIRMLLDRPDLFAAQTRAVLRAAARHGTDLRLMFPMVTSVDELARARGFVEAIQREERITLAHPLQIGAMIEVPGAALIADALAREADFFSLGTNDLVQYTLACDRGNARVAPLCRFAHPGVLRLIDTVVRAAHAARRTVGVCGEAAGDSLASQLLVGLGVDELSASPEHLLDLRARLHAMDHKQLQRLASRALSLATADDVTDLFSHH